jgi:PhnB protein
MGFIASTYLTFPGTAAEAFPYYQDVFGGELEVMTYGENPMEGMPFEPDPNAVAHAQLEAPGLRLTGGDAMGSENLPTLASEVYSIMLIVDTVDEARKLIDRLLADGGSAPMPFEKAPWGDHYGQVHDKFGLRWDVDVPGPR